MPRSTTARTPPPRSSIAVPVRRRAATSSAWLAAPGTGRPAARSASRWTTRRRRARGSSASRSSSIVPRPNPLAPRARRRRARRAPRPRRAAARPCAARCAPRRVDLRQRRDEPVADAVARVAALGVGRVVAPLEPALFAVGGRLLPGEAEQRAHQAAVALAHPEQGPAAGRGGEAVEDRLDLVVGGVAGGDQGAVRQRQPRRGGVARCRAPRPAGCRGPRDAAAARSRAARRAARRARAQCASSASESSRRP